MKGARHTGAAGVLFLCLFLVVLAPAAGQTGSRETTTYSIQIHEDGSALWTVEFRTLLAGDADETAFANYTRELKPIHLPEFQALMERSVSQAAVATGRSMQARDFTSDSAIQTVPTGTYGVVRYTFTWDGFAEKGGDLEVGDAFVGGLYLTRDHTLVLQPPDGYVVREADPAPDRAQGDLVWYGMRSFGPGEPEVVLTKEGLPITVIWAAAAAGAIILLVAFVFLRRKKEVPSPPEPAVPEPAPLPEVEERNLEDRILHLLETAGGEMYQSEMTQRLGMPKSTVSAALAVLHEKKAIVKVKKGRENLIRLSHGESGPE